MKTKELVASLVLILSLICMRNVSAADEFDAVRCGSDFRQALIGKKMAHEPVVKTEARHKDLQLKDLGAEIVSDDERLNLIFWLICEDEYLFLTDGDLIRDVLKFPKHSKETPQFDGFCELNGKKLPEVVLGVLKREEGAAMFQALQAWKIDEKKKKFIPLPTEGLRCGPDGISSEDSAK